MKLHFDVLGGDILMGERSCGRSCPVARSMQRKLGGQGLHVAAGWVRFRFWGKERTPDLPPEVADFVHKFDCGAMVLPFGFDLEF